MSAGYGSGLPDYNGGSGGGPTGDGRGGEPSYGSDPYATNGPAKDPYAQDQNVQDPYAQDPYGQDPYAADPLAADGFGPVFGSSAQAQPGGYAVATYDPAQQYGAHPSGPPGYGYYPPPLPSSGAGITGFVLGLLALTMCAGLTAPIGIIFAAMGMKETGPTATNRKGGRGIAIAGLVTSLVGLIPFLFLVLYVVFFIVAIGAGAASS